MGIWEGVGESIWGHPIHAITSNVLPFKEVLKEITHEFPAQLVGTNTLIMIESLCFQPIQHCMAVLKEVPPTRVNM